MSLSDMFDLGLRRVRPTVWVRFAEPVNGLRLYFRCGCRLRAALFPWLGPQWDVLDAADGYRRPCAAHRVLLASED